MYARMYVCVPAAEDRADGYIEREGDREGKVEVQDTEEEQEVLSVSEPWNVLYTCAYIYVYTCTYIRAYTVELP